MLANRRLPDGSIAFQDRRDGADRRLRAHLLADWSYAYRGRRRGPRRLPDGETAFVDLYEPALLVSAVGILLLSVLDAAFTLVLLQAGVVEEANPFMRMLIEHDVSVFINLKIVITGAAVVFLVICSKAVVLRRIRGRSVMNAVLALYAIVITYELFLLRLLGS
ncbi:MAG: DUF5658 family protein [Longimicrobiales bacterium]